MKIQSLGCPSFGKLYCNAAPESLTPTQRDVFNDIKDVLDENNIIKRLEDLKFDIYLESDSDGHSVNVALFKNLKFKPDKSLSYSKVVMLGGFTELSNRYKSLIDKGSNAISVDNLMLKFKRFFKGYDNNLYKRFVNYV